MPAKKLPPAQWLKNIPDVLRAHHNWVGHLDKRPVHPSTHEQARVNDPETWGTLDEAAAFYARTFNDPTAGVGFVFTERVGIVAVDFDHMLDGNKWVGPPEVQAFLKRTHSYKERSPSGTGAHLFIQGSLPTGAKHRRELPGSSRPGQGVSAPCEEPGRPAGADAPQAVEMWDRAHYVTVTGDIVGAERNILFDAAAVPTLLAYLGQRSVSADARPPEPERMAEAAEALSFIDPDEPYPEWIKTGMALRDGLGPAGRDLFVAWSQQGTKYREGEPEAKWGTFTEGGGVGFGTLLWKAKLSGYLPYGADQPPEEVFKPVVPEVDTKDWIVKTSAWDLEKIDWLWTGRIALGHITLLAGDPGQGKSIVSLDVASRLSSGVPLPGEKKKWKSQILLLNAEDGPNDTMAPRLMAAGANRDLVYGLNVNGKGQLQIPDEVAKLEAWIKKLGNVVLVVLDPLNTCIAMRLDSHKDKDVRQALMPLARMAQRLHVAIVLIVHLNKTTEGSALYRVSGSIGVGAAARSVLFVGTDDESDDDGMRVLAQAKPQLGPPPPALRFHVVGSKADADVGVVEWLGESVVTAEDMVQPKRRERSSKAREAAAWLAFRLANGPVPSRMLIEEATERGFNETLLKRVKAQAGAVAQKSGPDGSWVWRLS